MQTFTDPSLLVALRPLFYGLPTSFFLEAMIHGNCAFRAWSADDYSTALLWDERGLLFPVGAVPDGVFLGDLGFLLNEIILPIAQARGQDAFLLHPSSLEWDETLAALFSEFTFNRYPRVLYQETAPLPANWREHIPPGMILRPIDRKLLAESSLEGHDGLVEEIEECWPSMRRFLEHGFGFAVLDGRTIACRITGEYAYPGHIGIGILTAERYRGRGLAVLATLAFLEECVQRGLHPHWDAWFNNKASVRAAEKSGFYNPLAFSALVAYLPGQDE
jgi:GNAT superfamily N-acetyltransferase